VVPRLPGSTGETINILIVIGKIAAPDWPGVAILSGVYISTPFCGISCHIEHPIGRSTLRMRIYFFGPGFQKVCK
jgi:hypothetical protein